jgi:phosphoribosylformylglycinamidine (FGAM) synthase-like amidotransferase family enzyme
MLKFIAKILNIIPNQRAFHRFDISQIEDLNIKINELEFKLNTIAMGGLSFHKREIDKEFFNYNGCVNAIISFKNESVNVEINIVHIDNTCVACKVTGNISEFQKFFSSNLSFLVPSQY